MPKRATVSASAATTGSPSVTQRPRVGAGQAPAHAGADLLEPPGDGGGRGVGVRVVDDVVGHPREAVERVDRRALRRGEQARGEEVGPAVHGVQRPALRVGVAQRRVGDAGGVQLGGCSAR